MITRSNELDDLLESVEKVREEKYPNISSKLIESIINIESESIDSRTEAGIKVSNVISQELSGIKED